MKRQYVASSNLRSVGYHDGLGILEVEFLHGGVYQYLRVPHQTHRALMAAGSKGQYFNACIKDRFACRQVG